MIAFLTLCYVALLFILIKLKVIQLTLWWKLSPLAWIVLLFTVLFMPMQWGAPGGATKTLQYVIEIIPNVTGQVTEVPVQPLHPLKKGAILFKIESRPFQDTVNRLEATLKLSKINLKRAKLLYARKVGAKIEVDRFNTKVNQIAAELDAAMYKLDSTVVRAPEDGYVIGLSLRPGHHASDLPTHSLMSFVISNQYKIALGVSQHTMRHIRVGQPAEVTFKLLPGKIFNATVTDILPITQDGQLTPSGNIPLAPTTNDEPLPFSIVLKIEDDLIKDFELGALNINNKLPGGALGTGAIYTDSAKATHVIRKVMLRMTAWLNYIMP